MTDDKTSDALSEEDKKEKESLCEAVNKALQEVFSTIRKEKGSESLEDFAQVLYNNIGFTPETRTLRRIRDGEKLKRDSKISSIWPLIQTFFKVKFTKEQNGTSELELPLKTLQKLFRIDDYDLDNFVFFVYRAAEKDERFLLRSVTDTILDVLKKQFGAFGGVFLLIDEKKENLCTYNYSRFGSIEWALKKTSIRPMNPDYKYPLNEKEMGGKQLLIVECVKKKKTVMSDQMADFFAPIVPSLTLNWIQSFLRVKQCIALPVCVNDEVIGVLFAAFNKAEVSENDIKLLEAYVGLCDAFIGNRVNIRRLERSLLAA